MIRLATLDDRPHFLRLWASLLEEQHKGGAQVLPTRNNLYLCLEAFENYATGREKGLSMFWWPEDSDEPVGLAMGGEDVKFNRWDTNLDKLCTLWGVYVDPPYRKDGVAGKLLDSLVHTGIAELGFDHVEVHVLETNTASRVLVENFAGKPFLYHYIISMQEAKSIRE